VILRRKDKKQQDTGRVLKEELNPTGKR
jgi:hypothetical protein